MAMIDSIVSEDRNAVTRLDPEVKRSLWDCTDLADDYAQGANDRLLSEGPRKWSSAVEAVFVALAGGESGVFVHAHPAWLDRQLALLSPTASVTAAARLDAMACVCLWARSLAFSWRAPRRYVGRGRPAPASSASRTLCFGGFDDPLSLHRVSREAPLDVGLVEMLDRLRSACLAHNLSDRRSSPLPLVKLTEDAYRRLLDAARAEVEVSIDREVIAALVPQMWSAIRTLKLDGRSPSRLAPVLRLALSIYGIATVSALATDARR
jgi:hypothetical protein